MLQGCGLFKQYQNLLTRHCVAGLQAVQVLNLPARHCVAGVQAVLVVSEPTCQVLCYRGAGCLSCVGTYLLGTVLQGCRLFKGCLKLPAGHCVAGVQTF